MKRERIRTRKSAGMGKFILGWFVGFVSTILMLVGVGYWAYTSISVGRIEKWTKSNIAGDNEGLRKLTLEDAVGIATGIAKGSDDYTLAKFEEDFGVKLFGDELYGINLDKLKNSPIKNMKTAFEDTLNAATFNNILSLMEVESEELGLLNTVLSGETTYYINNGKLCTLENDESSEVDFKYVINGHDVQLDTGAIETIVDGKVKFALINLPLSTAVSSLSKATSNLEIYEIMGYYKNPNNGKYYEEYNNGIYATEVTGIMSTLAGKTIDELTTDGVETIKIYEVMSYYEHNGNYYKNYDGLTYSNEVTGVMKSIAGKTIKQLAEDGIDEMKIYEIMGYYKNGDKYYKDFDGTTYANEMTGVMSAISGKTIDELSQSGAFDDIYIYEVMGYYKNGDRYYKNYDGSNYTNEVTGVMSAIAGKTINRLSQANAFDDIYIYDVMGYYKDGDTYYKSFDGENYSNEITGVMKSIAGKTIGELGSDDTGINTLTLGEALAIEEGEATGVVKTFYNTPINQLSAKIKDIKIYEALGYYEYEDNYYETFDGITYTNQVTGLIATLAGFRVDQLSNASTFNGIYVYEVMGYYKEGNTYYKSFDGENYGDEVTGVMKSIVGKTLDQLGSADNGIDTLTLGEALDIAEDEATGVVKTFYSTPINQLSAKIADIKIYEALGYYENDGKYYETFDGTTYSNQVTGLIATLAGFGVDELSDANTFKNVHIYEVMGYYENDGKYYKAFDGEVYSDEVTGVMKSIAGKTLEQLGSTDGGIESLTLGEVLDIKFDAATGVIKTFYNVKINELANNLQNIKIYQALGYYENDGKYYESFDGTNYSDEVTGMMATLAPYSINDLSNSETFNDLYIYEVKGYYYDDTTRKYYHDYDGTTYSNEVTGIMAMMADAQLKNIEVKVDEIINETKLKTLFDTGIIDGSSLSENTKNIVNDMTIPELMIYIDELVG